MPGGGDGPAVDLGPALAARLRTDLLWVLLVATLAGVVVFVLSRRAPDTVTRLRCLLFGDDSLGTEPGARRFVRRAFGALWVVDGLLQAQPAMPTGFIREVVQPQVSAAPSWLGDLVAPLARAWARHPVAADSATVWVQVGLGALLLLGGRGLIARVGACGALLWSLVVWVFGEAFGGLFATGATWWTGAPGAVLAYAVASALLLVPWTWWTSGRAPALSRRVGAAWMLFGAVLQAMPGEQAWSSSGAAAPFQDGAANHQPEVFRRPIALLARVAAESPAIVNATTIGVLLVVGAALLVTDRPVVTWAGLLVCAATWWLAQDFGVLGGLGTDPDAALPIAVLLAAGLPIWERIPREQAVEPATAAPGRQPGRPSETPTSRARRGLGGAMAAAAVTAVLVLPALAGISLPGAAGADALAADSNGGVRTIPARPAPDFELTDQNGVRVSLAGARGKLVVLTFLDAVCDTDCPLIANQLAIADRRLGTRAAEVEFIAIDTNPVFHYRRDAAAFTAEHGMADLPNWHFVTGDPYVVQDLLAAYGITVTVPAVGMIEHTEAIYFLTADGREAAYLDDGAAEQLTTTYADQVLAEIRDLLK